jgi:hypothetical protein
MKPISKYKIGLRFGLLTGLVYAVLLFFRYRFFATNPVSFAFFVIVSYLLVLGMYLFTGFARKKELGGYGAMNEIFQSIFITILIAEAAYVVFNFIYLKFIDPAFWENFKAGSLSYYQNLKMTDEEIDHAMKGLKDADQQVKPVGLLKGYGFGIVMDSVFGLIFAAILRRKKPEISEIPIEPK